MNRTFLAAIVLFFFAATTLVADESEPVKWKLNRNVKDTVLNEIDQFEEDLKSALGAETLAFKPFFVAENHPSKAALEAATIEQMVDSLLKSMRKWADHDNQEYVPGFMSFRRAKAASGSDLLFAPRMMIAPSFGQLSGNVTFKVEWEQVDDRFKNNWDQNDVDEVYEVELNAKLTLGIWFSVKNDRKQTMISHSVTKPIVTGWRTSVVASEGEVQPILPATRPVK